MNTKGQVFENPIFSYVMIVAGLIFFGIVFLKIFTSIQGPVSEQLGNLNVLGADEAQTNWNAVMTPMVTMWDKFMIGTFIATTIILLVSSFMIDTHPFWIFLYILSNMILVLFMPGFIAAADTVYESSLFVNEVAYLPFMDSLRTHYMQWMLGIMFLSGVIIYGKVSLFGNTGSMPRGNGLR